MLTGDGGGKVAGARALAAWPQPCRRMLITWLRLVARTPGVSFRLTEVNGGPGAVFVDAQQRLLSVMALEIADGHIRGVRSVVNPDKLAHLGPVGDFRSLLRTAPAHE